MKGKLVSIISVMGFVVSVVSEYGFGVDFALTPVLWLVITTVALFATGTNAALTTNSWAAFGGGKWESNGNWSAGTPSSNNAIVIAVASPTAPATITIDALTSGSFPNSMTISNLIVARNGGGIHPPTTLVLNNAGTAVPLHILDAFSITTGGTVVITNSVVHLDSPHADADTLTDDGDLFVNLGTLNVGSSIGAPSFLTVGSVTPGALWLNGGQIVATNIVYDEGNGFINYGETDVEIGYRGAGQVAISNGTFNASQMYLGEFSAGTLTVAGGSLIFPQNDPRFGFPASLIIKYGTVWMTGGLLDLVADGELQIGEEEYGQMIQSNGNVVAGGVSVGLVSGSGTLTVAGGSFAPQGQFMIGTDPTLSTTAVTGTVWVVGGTVGVPDGEIDIAPQGSGAVIVSNGTLQAGFAYLSGYPGSQGTLTIAGGSSLISTTMILGSSLGLDATDTVWLTGGKLIVTNASVAQPAAILLGDGVGWAELDMSNGTLVANGILVGEYSPASLTMAGGTNIVTGVALYVGDIPGATGTVTLTGGQLVTTNADAYVGYFGIGVMTMSNSTWLARNALLGFGQPGQNGTGMVTVAGGTATFSSTLTIAVSNNTAGTVWLTGGQLDASDLRLGQGQLSFGQMIVSNGLVNIGTGELGLALNSFGWLTIDGGTVNVSTSLLVAAVDCQQFGWLTLNGGTLNVTNSAHNALLEMRGGTITMNGGTLRVDKLVVTNGCSRFIMNGGTLICTNIFLDPNGDADGDGIPNGYEVSHGLDPFNPADAALDSDGDGQSNLAEYLAGTDATNSASFFGITGISQISSNILVTWQTGPGRTNALQATLLVPGLVSWWRAESNALDSIGSNNGLAAAGTSYTPGKIGTGFLFDGVSGNVLIPDSTTLDAITNGIAVAAWIRRDAIVGPFPDESTIFSRRDPALSEGFSVSVTTSGVLHVTLRTVNSSTSAGSTFGSSGPVIPTNQFLHVAATYDALGGLFAYVNGANVPLSLVFGDTNVTGNLHMSTTWSIGQRQANALQGANAGQHFKGVIDEVQLYNRLLLPADIATIYKNAVTSYSSDSFMTIFTVTNTTGTVTNYLDVGAAANFSSRYYRVRLVQ